MIPATNDTFWSQFALVASIVGALIVALRIWRLPRHTSEDLAQLPLGDDATRVDIQRQENRHE